MIFIRVPFPKSLMLVQSDCTRVVAHVMGVDFFWACQHTRSSPPTCSCSEQFTHHLHLSGVSGVCVIVLVHSLFLCQDPAVTQHSSTTGYATLDLYNPFESTTAVSNSSSSPVRTRGSLSWCHGGEITVHTLLCCTQDRYMQYM